MDKDEPERQAHLSLRWETRHVWKDAARVLGLKAKPENAAAIAIALYAEHHGSGRRTSYSRAKTHYDLPRRYRSRLYSYRSVVGAVDQLDALGLIEHDRRPPGRRGWQSAMRAKPELIVALGEVMAPADLRMQALREPLLLRDEEGELRDYSDNRETHRMRREIQEQNEAVLGANLGNVITLPSRLRRIFNEGFGRGGRFYAEGGAWQTLPKQERLRIVIDGEPVVEIDYAAFHPTLLYAELGLPAPTEPYAAPGFSRDLVKIAFNVILNSTGRPGARYTLAHKRAMAEDIIGMENLPDESFDDLFHRLSRIVPGYAQHANRRADELIEAILERHASVQHLFFSGVGTQLQRIDSDIAEDVMRMMHRRGIVVLPVHDSFIVAASKADVLEEVMREAAARRGVQVGCKRFSSVPMG